MTYRGFLFLLAITVGVILGAQSTGGSNPAWASPNGSLGIDHNLGASDINAGPMVLPGGTEGTIVVVTEAPDGGLGAWGVNIHYDPAVITPTACTSYYGACNIHFSSVEVRFNGIHLPPGVTGTTALADIRFLASGPPASCSSLDPEVTTWADPDAMTLPDPDVSSGSICVSSAAVGGTVEVLTTEAPYPTSATHAGTRASVVATTLMVLLGLAGGLGIMRLARRVN